MAQNTNTETTVSIISEPLTINVPILANFNYYAPPPDGPGEPSPNDLELILGTKNQDTRCLPVHDVRGHEADFNLKESGFRYANRPSTLKASQERFLARPVSQRLLGG